MNIPRNFGHLCMGRMGLEMCTLMMCHELLGDFEICTLNPARACVSSYSVHCTETVVAVLVNNW